MREFKMRLNLIKARNNLHLNQRQLADKIGVSKGLIAQIETGKRLGSVRVWDKLERLLLVSQQHLREDYPLDSPPTLLKKKDQV
jgi:DNA-binding XRE family transcriptional regulator